MRARSDRYPDNNNSYIDTTYYDEEEKYLDLGFQRLKFLNPTSYPNFSFIVQLYIDHNNLTELPQPSLLPHLEELTCASNNLQSIPYYPKLIFLNISKNKITKLSHYQNSLLQYFDCSYNENFEPNFSLPHCKQLYIDNTNLAHINLKLFPKLEILDCENNRLTNIMESNTLLEINVQHNLFTSLPSFPKIIRIMADHNKITSLNTYPELLSLTITYNKLVKIDAQPKLKKIIANNNYIENIGSMPKLRVIDFGQNKLEHFDFPIGVRYVSIQFNPISKLHIGNDVLQNIKELQINFESYRHIYSKYYDKIEFVSIIVNEERLNKMLGKMNEIFDEKMLCCIAKYLKKIDFRNCSRTLFVLSLQLYRCYFLKNSDVREFIGSKEFQCFFKSMMKLYHSVIVITLYFNGFDHF